MDDMSSDDLQNAIDDILGDSSDDEISKILKPTPRNNYIAPRVTAHRRSLSACSPASPHSQKISNEKPVQKCSALFIGPPSLESGCTHTASLPKFCSNLFCISCDHSVIRFNDRKWAPGTNYLFLRNNYPDTVHSKLIKAVGSSAYCCQCTFRDVTEVTQLSSFSSNWVCRGHTQ